MQKLILIAVLATIFAPALADEYEGDYLYRVSTVRAATGFLAELLDSIHELKAGRYYADAGETRELLDQRRMENAYLAATDQTQNMIFHRAAGSDIDVFTIGFHANLEAFAKPASVTPKEKASAVKVE
jgi:hypothetical protein